MNEKGPLSGYRVLDLTDEKGRFCGRLLADMGMEVVRVDRPSAKSAKSAFEVDNLGKRSVTLDLEAEKGRELFRKLVKTADVLVESFSPGYLERLGLGYLSLREVNPWLIMASITPFGQSGPYRDYKADDLVAAALGGQVCLNGEPGLPPLKPYGNQTYRQACLVAANGIMLALWQRQATNWGQHIDISLQECAAAGLDHALVRYFYRGEVAKRQGSRYWNSAFRVFPCRDGFILLSLFHQWPTLVEWLADEGMADDLADRKWLEAEKRLEDIDHIIDVLERWIKTHSVDELVEKGQLMRFPWAKVNTPVDLYGIPQLAARDFWIEVEQESGGKVRLPGAGAKLSASPWQPCARTARPGEDNTAIFRGELELSAEEMMKLAEEGVI